MKTCYLKTEKLQGYSDTDFGKQFPLEIKISKDPNSNSREDDLATIKFEKFGCL